MIGVQCGEDSPTVWLEDDKMVLAKIGPRRLGGSSDWSAVPPSNYTRISKLRVEATPPERRLWQALRNGALGVKFRRQHPIGPYIVDFYSRDAQLCVEVDGAAAHDGERKAEYDLRREMFLSNLGLRVIRVTATDVQRNIEGVVEFIREACERLDSSEGAKWVDVKELRKGDFLFADRYSAGLRITRVVRGTANV